MLYTCMNAADSNQLSGVILCSIFLERFLSEKFSISFTVVVFFFTSKFIKIEHGAICFCIYWYQIKTRCVHSHIWTIPKKFPITTTIFAYISAIFAGWKFNNYYVHSKSFNYSLYLSKILRLLMAVVFWQFPFFFNTDLFGSILDCLIEIASEHLPGHIKKSSSIPLSLSLSLLNTNTHSPSDSMQ